MSFINDDFMLKNETAKKLYHSYAKDLPIIDYHCHIPPQKIAENYKFKNAYDLFLGGDHYKWRLMRAHGVEELVGPHGAEGHHQQHGGPGRGEAQHQHQQGDADDPHHHSFEHCVSPFPASRGTPPLSNFFTPPKRRSRC